MMASLCKPASRRPDWPTSFADLRGRDSSGGPSRILAVSGRRWNWIAAEPFFFRKIPFDGSAASHVALFQIFCVGLAALIPLGSGADRWRLRASCLSTGMLAALTYPLFAHWGVGRRVAGASGRQLWNRPRISGCWGRRHGSGPGRPHGPGGHVGSWSHGCGVFCRWHGACNPRPQWGSGAVWLRARLGRLDWA